MEIMDTNVTQSSIYTPAPDASVWSAVAEENVVHAAESVALKDERVSAVRSAETDDAVLLALLTGPIYLASERKAMKTALENEASDLVGKRVIVTFDMEIYRKLGKDLTSEEIAKLFTKVN